MESRAGSIAVSRALRFRELQTGTRVDRILFVLHGYGQLVEYFIRKFAAISIENTLIVAPEGMHRFYLQGSSGRVGASWMTKEWREQDILENVQALNQLYLHFSEQYPQATVSVLGFSQGGATAARWVADGQVPCTHFISWASVFPPDLSAESMAQLSMRRQFCLGNEDPYFIGEDAERMKEFYRTLQFEVVGYSGKHDIDAELLLKLLEHE